ncbi:MAG: tRNA (guanosine(46)-N7)-methyltransferase TrmB, partial [Chromatiaceae bacterium]|nr:tRNA (guanosine(46)-N7)-methyltransferase TrmB [Chromatiaceae bacterium]
MRSYVLRQGRLTEAQERAFAELWPRYGVERNPGQALDLPALFGNDQPVYLEIGFGNGETLAEIAERHPERNYLGI